MTAEMLEVLARRSNWAYAVGDCREVLRSLPDACVDSVVTDSPYELKFLGRAWDSSGVAFDRDTWRQILRVMKPGAHLVGFGHARLYHRLAVAVEDAGAELRTSLMWLYGQGAPKGVDISKAIDKIRDDDVRPVCRFLRAALEARGLKPREVAARFNFHPRMVEHWAARDTDSQPTVPTPEQWEALRELVGFGPELDAEVARLNGRKGEPGDTWKNAKVVGEYADRLPGVIADRFKSRDRLKREPSEAARKWLGWNTALKTAFEPIVMARRATNLITPRNVMEHGTGALNIGACRIGAADDGAGGRWPPNVVMTHGVGCVRTGTRVIKGDARAGRQELGTRPGGFGAPGADKGDGKPTAAVYGDQVVDVFACEEGCAVAELEGQAPDASRFYPIFEYEDADFAPFRYVAKPNLEERSRGLDERNEHVTVKPIEMMRWLCRLITPPGGVVLDPFAGSGTTLIAALRDGFRTIGVELEPGHAPILDRRVSEDTPLFNRRRST